MDLSEQLVADCEPEALFEWVDDLGRYPEWLGLVPRAVPAGAVDDDPGPAWTVDLRGRVGPLSRSKRLRMVRTVHETPTHARFERREVDGRDHSAWVLDAVVAADGDGSRLTMSLHYGGNLWVPLLERLLRQEIERSRPRLIELIS